MARRRHTPEQIIKKLREAEVAIAEGATEAIHADLDVGSEQAGGEGIGRKLCALVGVEDLGPTHALRAIASKLGLRKGWR